MPNRILKESICYSADIDRLTPFAEVVFYRLIVNCDDYGRMDARPEFLKSRLFATRPGVAVRSIQKAVESLAQASLIRRYEVEGRPYLLFPKWARHQRIRNSREKYPAPAEEQAGEREDCGELPREAAKGGLNPIQSESNLNSNPNPKGGAARFTPPTLSQVREYCGEWGAHIDPEAFVDFYESKGWMVGASRMRDWKAAVRTWEKRESSKNERRGQTGSLERHYAPGELEAKIKDPLADMPGGET